MPIVVTATKARRELGDVIIAATSGARVDVAKHGKPPLVSIVSAARLDELEAIEERLATLVAESEAAAGAA